jgi:LPS sulfotransferase NodH
MKILVLSHTRCGSTTLCKWISREMNIELDETPYDKKTFSSVFDKTNIVRKIVIEEFSPPDYVINKFDKVICLTRENSVETAISFIVAKMSNEWHIKYEVTDDWIIENKNEIIRRKNWYDNMKLVLKKFNTLQIKYENIYVNKTEINSVIDYLNLENPQHLDMLDYTKKYRKDTQTLIHDFDRKNII